MEEPGGDWINCGGRDCGEGTWQDGSCQAGSGLIWPCN